MTVLGLSMAGYALAVEPVVPAAAAPVAQPAEGKTIFSFQKELGLTDKQVTDIKTLTGGLKDALLAKTQQITILRQDLNKMVSEREEIKKIRAQLQKIADIQVDNTCRDLEVSRKVEAVLSAEQWKQWKGIQEKTRAEVQAKAVVPLSAAK